MGALAAAQWQTRRRAVAVGALSPLACCRRWRAVAVGARAAWRLVRALLLKRGLLDGRLGACIAVFSAYEVFLKYRKLRSLNRTFSRADAEQSDF